MKLTIAGITVEPESYEVYLGLPGGMTAQRIDLDRLLREHPARYWYVAVYAASLTAHLDRNGAGENASGYPRSRRVWGSAERLEILMSQFESSSRNSDWAETLMLRFKGPGLNTWWDYPVNHYTWDSCASPVRTGSPRRQSWI